MSVETGTSQLKHSGLDGLKESRSIATPVRTSCLVPRRPPSRMAIVVLMLSPSAQGTSLPRRRRLIDAALAPACCPELVVIPAGCRRTGSSREKGHVDVGSGPLCSVAGSIGQNVCTRCYSIRFTSSLFASRCSQLNDGYNQHDRDEDQTILRGE